MAALRPESERSGAFLERVKLQSAAGLFCAAGAPHQIENNLIGQLRKDR